MKKYENIVPIFDNTRRKTVYGTLLEGTDDNALLKRALNGKLNASESVEKGKHKDFHFPNIHIGIGIRKLKMPKGILMS